MKTRFATAKTPNIYLKDKNPPTQQNFKYYYIPMYLLFSDIVVPYKMLKTKLVFLFSYLFLILLFYKIFSEVLGYL